MRILLVTLCTQELGLFHSPLCIGPARKELVSQECSHSWARRWAFHFLSNKCPEKDLLGVYRTQEQWSSWDRILLVTVCTQELGLFHGPLYTGSCQKRPGLSGVLTQAYRPTRGTSSSQRQQDQLTPEITRWWKASTRTLLRETKTTWQHQNPVLLPQQVPDTPTHWQSKSWVKLFFIGLDFWKPTFKSVLKCFNLSSNSPPTRGSRKEKQREMCTCLQIVLFNLHWQDISIQFTWNSSHNSIHLQALFMNLKSYLTMLIEDIKKDLNSSLKEIREKNKRNTGEHGSTGKSS